MNRVVVIGAGTMGNGIAHTAAASGLATTLLDVSEPFLERALSTISANLQRGVDKGRMTPDEKEKVLGRIATTTDLESIGEADLVIEAIIESVSAKTELFRKLDQVTKPGCILASNTSSISITRIAAATKRPEKVIGMHFMNPVPVMTLVEVVRGIATADETYRQVEDLSKRMGKTPIEVNDSPGDLRAVRRGRHAPGDRRSDETGDESPDGTPDARGFHRPRRLPGDSPGAGRRIRGSEIPPLPPAHQDGGRRVAGTEERAGVLYVLVVSEQGAARSEQRTGVRRR
jgi:hypothetical protein